MTFYSSQLPYVRNNCALLFLIILIIAFACVPAQAATPLTCVVSGNTALLRAEGETELTGDLNLNCTGGTPGTSTEADISVVFNTDLTSRLLSSNKNEVLLLVGNPQPAQQQVGVNVFEGTTVPLTNGAGNTFRGVQFTGVSIAAPAAGESTMLRITNLRVNAAELYANSSIRVRSP